MPEPGSTIASRVIRTEELPFKHDALAYGMYELPVTW
jgi:hypothetical protein